MIRTWLRRVLGIEVCRVCGALVDRDGRRAHERWHLAGGR